MSRRPPPSHVRYCIGPDDAGEWVRPGRAARALRLTLSWVREAALLGFIPHRRLRYGHGMLVRVADIADALARGVNPYRDRPPGRRPMPEGP